MTKFNAIFRYFLSLIIMIDVMLGEKKSNKRWGQSSKFYCTHDLFLWFDNKLDHCFDLYDFSYACSPICEMDTKATLGSLFLK